MMSKNEVEAAPMPGSCLNSKGKALRGVNLFGGKFQRSHLLLIGVCVISLMLRLWLVDKKWLNPDEGAQLMDAALVLDGYIPEVDFGSRQPLYVYVLAGFLKLFGISYIAGRLYAVTFSLLSGIIIFLLAKALFDKRVALLSTAMYWMIPLEVLQSTVVKTQPLVTFLTCLSLYFAVRFSQAGRRPWMIGAGGAAAMAFYVRESSLVIPLIVIGYLFVLNAGRARKAAQDFGFFLAGYLAVVMLVMGAYSQYMRPEVLLTGGLSPFGFLAKAGGQVLQRLRGWVWTSNDVQSSNGFDDPLALFYPQNLNDTLSLHSFLLVGLGFSFAAFGYHHLVWFLRNTKAYSRPYTAALVLLYGWVCCLLVAYYYRFLIGGFWIDYFREFLPPLVIIFSAWLSYSIPAMNRENVAEKLVLVALGLGTIWFGVQSEYKISGFGYFASLTIALFVLVSFAGASASLTRRLIFVSIFVLLIALILVSRQEPLKGYFSGAISSVVLIAGLYGLTWGLLERTARPSVPAFANFMALSIILASFVVSIGYSAIRLDRSFDSPWSPESVEKVVAYLKDHTRDGDRVMSGAVIWEFRALRKPFEMISHPLRLIRDVSEETRRAIRTASESNPPRVIILDGITEITYVRNVPWLLELLQARYHHMLDTGTRAYPVKVYQLIEG